jgi:hypothetical protein
MTVNPAAQAAQLFVAHYGALVTGGAKTLPASGSGDIFTVTGGRVLVTSITGVVTTAIQNQTCTLSVGHKPTGGSSQAATLATATAVANAALGTSIDVTGASFPAALIVLATTSVVKGSDLGTGLTSGGLALVPAGTIQVTTSATNTGAITYSVTYVPYDSGAVITAA